MEIVLFLDIKFAQPLLGRGKKEKNFVEVCAVKKI